MSGYSSDVRRALAISFKAERSFKTHFVSAVGSLSGLPTNCLNGKL